MDPISNVDQLVLLLRQRLQERSGAARVAKPGARRPDPRRATGVTPLAALTDLDDRQFRRALIQNLLSDKIGRHLVNEAGFQQVVEQVTGALEQDPTAGALLDRVVSDLRAAGR